MKIYSLVFSAITFSALVHASASQNSLGGITKLLRMDSRSSNMKIKAPTETVNMIQGLFNYAQNIYCDSKDEEFAIVTNKANDIKW